MKSIWHLKTNNGVLTQPIPDVQLGLYVRNTDGSPARAGDVYSVEPDGAIKACDPANAKEWETCVINGPCLVYTAGDSVTVFLPDNL